VRFLAGLALFFVLNTVDVFAQDLLKDSGFRTAADRALHHYYNYQPDSARFVMQPWKTRFPKHPVWSFWSGFETWWIIAADMQDKRRDRTFFYQLERCDYECGILLSRQPGSIDALILKASANAFMARLAANREEWIRSINYGQAAYEAVEMLKKIAPDDPDLLFPEGLMQYYAAALPERYPIPAGSLNWFLGTGNKFQGMHQLERASKESLFMKQEARYFAANILLYYENQPMAALAYAQGLVRDFPSNPFFAKHYLRILSRTRQPAVFREEATKIRKSFTMESAANAALHEELQFFLAQDYEALGNTEKAITAYTEAVQRSEKLTEGRQRTVWKQGMLALVRLHQKNGNTKEADKLLKILLAANPDSETAAAAKMLQKSWE
jgi:tetratricopeptide (TPR) repeat protein